MLCVSIHLSAQKNSHIELSVYSTTFRSTDGSTSGISTQVFTLDDGDPQRIGMHAHNLKPHLVDDSEVNRLFSTYRKFKWAQLSTYVGTFIIWLSPTLGLSQADQQEFSYIRLGAGFAVFAVGVGLNQLGHKRIKKAIELHNGIVSDTTYTPKLKLNPCVQQGLWSKYFWAKSEFSIQLIY